MFRQNRHVGNQVQHPVAFAERDDGEIADHFSVILPDQSLERDANPTALGSLAQPLEVPAPIRVNGR